MEAPVAANELGRRIDELTSKIDKLNDNIKEFEGWIRDEKNKPAPDQESIKEWRETIKEWRETIKEWREDKASLRKALDNEVSRAQEEDTRQRIENLRIQPAKSRPFRDGLPRLVRWLSPSAPSVPSVKQHLGVELVEKSFGSLSSESWAEICGFQSRVWTDARGDVVEYASENDVAVLVAGIVKDLIGALKLDAKVFSEVGTFAVRPDLWVLTLYGTPIGVVEVKKPDFREKPAGKSVLDEPTVLGELYDFMLQLPNFYGVDPVFGILATFESWRVCWLPSNSGDEEGARDEEKKEEESMCKTPPKLVTETNEKSPPGMTPSKLHPNEHSIEDDDLDNVEVEEKSLPEKRVMHGSKIFRSSESGDVAMKAVAGALCKMARARATPFQDPFEKLDKRTVLCFEKGEAGRCYWDHLKQLKKGQWNKYANPPKYLYAIEDLGRGADGRVWLTCSHSGAVCVLKFPNGPVTIGQASSLKHEEEMWHKVYPQFQSKVVLEKWCGREALRMPHFSAVKVEERKIVLELVKATLKNDFHGKGMVHGDVAWRNIGLYKEGAEKKAIVFDMVQVRVYDKDDDWMESALSRLESK